VRVPVSYIFFKRKFERCRITLIWRSTFLVSITDGIKIKGMLSSHK
jgi:hypothetical protein